MKRNYGIDLLRMVLMFMVVVLHVLGHGGVLDTAVPLSMNYALAWLLECFAYCAVNCYALITGYVYYNSKYRLSSLIQIWIQVWIYSFGISVAMWILKPEYFSIEGLIRAALPVTYKMYWYFSAYVGLFMLIPILNAAIECMSENKTKNVLLLSALFFSVIPVVSGEDPFGDKGGYSTFWLAYLYLIGASIRKYEWEKVLKNSANNIYIYIFSVCISWVCKLAGDYVRILLPEGIPIVFNLVSYTSPTMVLAAIGLFLTFRQVELGQRASKIVATLSPAAFGVYLIHEQINVKSYFISDRFCFLASANPAGLIIGVIGCAFAVFAVCLIADYVRLIVFKKLKIKEKVAIADRIMQ